MIDFVFGSVQNKGPFSLRASTRVDVEIKTINVYGPVFTTCVDVGETTQKSKNFDFSVVDAELCVV